MPAKPKDQPVDELKLIVSELMLGVSGIKNRYGSPRVNPKPMNDELDELYYKTVERLQAECNRARLAQLDELIDINSMTFNRWTQKDIAHFFERVGVIYRELEQQLMKGGDVCARNPICQKIHY